MTNALTAPIVSADANVDMRVVRGVRSAPAGASEQLLPDFYCEHTTLAMNRERRKQVGVRAYYSVANAFVTPIANVIGNMGYTMVHVTQ